MGQLTLVLQFQKEVLAVERFRDVAEPERFYETLGDLRRAVFSQIFVRFSCSLDFIWRIKSKTTLGRDSISHRHR